MFPGAPGPDFRTWDLTRLKDKALQQVLHLGRAQRIQSAVEGDESRVGDCGEGGQISIRPGIRPSGDLLA